MKDILKLNFLPTYSYRFFIIAIIGILSTILLIVSTILKFNIINVEVLKWILAFFFSVMTFSKEKIENEKFPLLKYYAGKAAIIFLIGFTLAIRATELLMNRIIAIENINLIIFGLVSYSIAYQVLKFSAKNRTIQFTETVFPDNVKYNPTLSWIVLILSITTLILLFVIG